MTSLANINSYLANDPSIEMRTKKTLQKCFNELSYTVNLPVALVDGGTAADLSATGGTNQVVMQEGPGNPFTVRALTAADINTFTYDPTILNALGENDLVNVGGGPGIIDTYIMATTLTDVRFSFNDYYDFTNNPATDGGQILNLVFKNAVTNIAYVAGNNSVGLTFPTTASAGDTFGFVWSAAETAWVRFL